MSVATVGGTDNPLSEREQDVAQWLAIGATNAEIARELTISPHTVKVHVRNIFEKLEVSSRTEASMVLIQHGWVTIPGLVPIGDVPKATQPDPEPLTDLDAQPATWQRYYLLAVIVVLIGFIWLPSWTGRPETRPDLLTDVGAASLGQPLVTLAPRWEPRTPLVQPRSRMAIVRDGDSVVAMGGESDDGALATVVVYDLRINEWTSFADLPEPLANSAATILDDTIYIGGGSRTEKGAEIISNQFRRYDAETNSWELLFPLPFALAGSEMVVANNTLYLMGGWDGQRMHDEIWRLQLDESGETPAGTWESVANLESPRAFFGAETVDDELYIVGGYDGQQELSDATRYNLDEGTKQSLPPLATPRGGLSLVFDGLALNALGGGWTYPMTNHERFDPSTNVWSSFPSPIQGEWRHLGAVSKDGRLNLLGGWSNAYLDSHLQYQSTFRAMLPVITN
jgi:DNA-binding CsgD family transcriptional regulator